MTRRRRAVGWTVVLAALLVIPSRAVAERASESAPISSGPPAGASPTAAAGPSRTIAPAVVSTDGIVPGSVNRTSINLTAEYDVTLRVNFATRAFRVDSLMTIT